MEEWKEVEGYEGRYEVSSFGNIRSVDRVDILGHFRPGRVLSQTPDARGYMYVVLYRDGEQKTKSMHRLVAEAFLDNPDNLPQVNHKDENKSNNNIENLEWCDAKYNMNYGTALSRRSKANRNHPRMSTPVMMFALDGTFIKRFPSQKEAARQTGVPQGSIGMACRGKSKRGGAYIWKFANGDVNEKS